MDDAKRTHLQNLIACADREVTRRERLMQKWEADPRARARASAELDLMRGIAAVLREVLAGPPPAQHDLFGGVKR